jgi:hypothetical protein
LGSSDHCSKRSEAAVAGIPKTQRQYRIQTEMTHTFCPKAWLTFCYPFSPIPVRCCCPPTWTGAARLCASSFGVLSRASLSRAGRGAHTARAVSLRQAKCDRSRSVLLRLRLCCPRSVREGINRHRNELSVPQHRPIQPRYRASIPRGPVSSVADRLAVSRERLPPEEGRSRCI